MTLGMASCATTTMKSSKYLEEVQPVLAASFRAEGQAGMDRLTPDEANRLCSQSEYEGKTLSDKQTEQIRNNNFKTIKWPSNGQFIGDYTQGEIIAQDGRGKTWSDKEGSVNGGNCYNCHQITQEEISHGTIGPSLYHYGKIRGVTDPNSAAAKPIVEYTWGKIWNAKAYNACSNMPRAGHMGILNQEQVRHIVALLLDPQSPVNK